MTIEEDLCRVEDAMHSNQESMAERCDAHAAFARLRAALAARSEPEWVRCEDRMPEPGALVWIFKNSSVMEGYYSRPSGAWYALGAMFSYAGTSWCPRYVEPVPAPPADTAKVKP